MASSSVPRFSLLSNRVGGSPSDDAITLAAVIELVHLATLVHDDAVDHSVLRRGLPTVNAVWTHQIAIIMGDYLYSRSVTELTRLGRLDAVAVLASAANEMSIGEMRQLTSYDALEFTESDYYRLIASKTASLMSAACEMGALAGVDEYRKPLAQFGHDLGMAFQIADDLLDYTGSEAVTGKPTGQDLRERKVTLPLVGALRNVSDVESREIRDFFTLVEAGDEDHRSGDRDRARPGRLGLRERAGGSVRGACVGGTRRPSRRSCCGSAERRGDLRNRPVIVNAADQPSSVRGLGSVTRRALVLRAPM